MTFTLGYKPEKFKVEMSANSDFTAALVRSNGTDWPAGSTLSLSFEGGQDFAAALDGTTATWLIDEADVNALIAIKPKSVKLWYVEGSTRLLWAIGSLTVT